MPKLFRPSIYSETSEFFIDISMSVWLNENSGWKNRRVEILLRVECALKIS
eukprot:m.279157 g.279157  ORF g.279157 m.279157 type:complete len:51 (+) comp16157_c1_seq2:3093-3245(+)